LYVVEAKQERVLFLRGARLPKSSVFGIAETTLISLVYSAIENANAQQGFGNDSLHALDTCQLPEAAWQLGTCPH
jgi:hypothetical protein